MKNIIILCLIVILLQGCSHQGAKDYTATIVPIKPQDEKLLFSSLFKSYELIQPSGEPISNIQKIIPCNDMYIILGSSNSSDLNMYSKDGLFLYSIIQTGKGPSEAINIIDVIHEEGSDIIDVLCDYGTKILKYSIKDKSVNATYVLPESYVSRSLERIGDTYYVLYKELPYSDKDEYKISLYNKNTQQIEYSFLPLDKVQAEYISFTQSNNLYKQNGKVYFYEAFLNAIYEIDTVIKKHVVFDGGRNQMSKDQIKGNFKDVMDFVEFCKNSGNIWSHINCFEVKGKIISRFRVSDQLYINIASPDKEQSHSYSTIYDDMIFNDVIQLNDIKFISNDNNDLYGIIEPTIFAKHPEVENVNTSEMSNPIIIKLEVR